MKHMVLLATYFGFYCALILLTEANLWTFEWWLIWLGSFSFGIVAQAFYVALINAKGPKS